MGLKIKRKFLGTEYIGLGCAIFTVLLFFSSYIWQLDNHIVFFLYIVEYILFFLCINISVERVFLSPYFWFLMPYFFYSSFFQFLYIFGNVNYYSLTYSTLNFTYVYSFRFLCVILFFYYISLKSYSNVEFINQMELPDRDETIAALAIMIFILDLSYFLWGGYIDYFASGTLRRTDINTYLIKYNLWIFLGYFNVYFIIYLLLKRNMSKLCKVIIWIPILFYYGISIMSGSRKQLLYIIIAVMLLITLNINDIRNNYFEIKKERSNSIKVLIPVICAFIVTMYYRVVIMDKGWSGNIYRKIASIGGEFIFPSITFPVSVQRNYLEGVFNYPTLLDSVLYFVPRNIFPYKNYSIAEIFSNLMNVNMGFASNPLLEGYVNFGNLGFLFEALIITFLLRFSSKLSRKNVVLFVFSIIFLIDLNRGEVSYYIRQMIEVALVFGSVNWIVKKINIRI